MKRRNRQQIRRRRTIVMICAMLVTGILWTVYGLSSTITSADWKNAPQLSGSPDNNKRMIMNEVAQEYIIVIDPGHGGKDPGAEGASGHYERDYTLALSTKVFELLQQEPGFSPYLTRSGDTFIELENRAQMANELEADAFISIHGNTFTDSSISGTETYYYEEGSIPLANEVHGQLVEAAGFKDRGVKHDGWMVLKKSERPAILVEVGFLTNPGDEAAMLSEAHQNQVAQAIANGIKAYFFNKQ
ncbi:N-acetylmuramoyl-L-alanine amidase [Paenibacillaceae bacterium]|nr:N-acetylmuramoyl-L-alanine amidase [Paenibacillaceae bacterium]